MGFRKCVNPTLEKQASNATTINLRFFSPEQNKIRKNSLRPATIGSDAAPALEWSITMLHRSIEHDVHRKAKHLVKGLLATMYREDCVMHVTKECLANPDGH